MKKIHRKKLILTATTVRTLVGDDLGGVHGGQPRTDTGVSVGTCTACLPTFNPTDKFSCRGNCA